MDPMIEKLVFSAVANKTMEEIVRIAAAETVPKLGQGQHCNCAAVVTAAVAGIEYGKTVKIEDTNGGHQFRMETKGKLFDELVQNSEPALLRLKYPNATEQNLEKVKDSAIKGVSVGVSLVKANAPDKPRNCIDTRSRSANKRRNNRSSSAKSNASKKRRSRTPASNKSRSRRSSKSSSSSSKRRGR